MYTIDKEIQKPLEEAKFKAGSAFIVMEKVIKILEKKTKSRIGLSPVPWTYRNKTGSYAGFVASALNKPFKLRFNFILSKSDEIVSVDYYKSKKLAVPTYTIDLNGVNIVKVVETIVLVINGEYKEGRHQSKPVLQEALRKKDLLQQWFDSDPTIKADLEGGKGDIETYYQKYKDYANQQRWNSSKVFNQVQFSIALKKLGKEHGYNFKVKGVRVRRGVSETPIVQPSDGEKEFNALFVENAHLKMFDALEVNVGMVADSSPFITSVIIYGQPGIGKTYMVTEILKEKGLKEDKDYVTFTGKVAGSQGLIQLLWDYRQGWILVFDDFDSVFDDASRLDILKGALDDKAQRFISYPKKRKKGTETDGTSNEISDNTNAFVVQDGETLDMTSVTVDSDLANRDVDNVSIKSVPGTTAFNDIPAKFEFKSHVIFISNKMNFDTAILSRSVPIKIDLTYEQTLDLIRSKLSGVMKEYPIITDDLKEYVLDFLVELSGTLDSIDFRKFKQAIVQAMCYGKTVEELKANEQQWQDAIRLVFMSM